MSRKDRKGRHAGAPVQTNMSTQAAARRDPPPEPSRAPAGPRSSAELNVIVRNYADDGSLR